MALIQVRPLDGMLATGAFPAGVARPWKALGGRFGAGLDGVVRHGD